MIASACSVSDFSIGWTGIGLVVFAIAAVGLLWYAKRVDRKIAEGMKDVDYWHGG